MKQTPNLNSNAPDPLERAVRLIRSARSPLLACHLAPDGDAIGSTTALAQGLRYLGSRPMLFCPDPIPSRYDFLPLAMTFSTQVTAPFDLVISLDCSDLYRLRDLPQHPGFSDAPLLNIDHHVTNTDFGSVNLVITDVSSTAEIVHRLLNALNVPLDVALATSLLTGVVTDTRGFRTPNVTPTVMETALRLMQAGASLPMIIQHTLERRDVATIYLWRQALSTVQLQNRVIWASISQDMRRQARYEENGDAGLVSFLISADEADVAAVFSEQEDGGVEVGMRAKPDYDVSQVAFQLGGGGHKLAAGCSIPGSLEEAQRRVLERLYPIVAQPGGEQEMG